MKKYNYFDLAEMPKTKEVPEDVNKNIVNFVKENTNIDISDSDKEIRRIKPFGSIIIPKNKVKPDKLFDLINETSFIDKELYLRYKEDFNTVWAMAQHYIINEGKPLIEIEFHKGVFKRYILTKYKKDGTAIKISVNNDNVDFSKKTCFNHKNNNPKEVNDE